MTHEIRLVERRLSDDSPVWDVALGTTLFHAVTLDDGIALANGLVTLIRHHTTGDARVVCVAIPERE